MDNRIAILDLGTNTFHLLIAEKKKDDWQVLLRDRQAVKIGQGGINESRILPDAMERAIAALKNFMIPIRSMHISRVYAFGTSAIRVAVNRDEFIKRVKDQTGITIRILSGDEEAAFIYHGVRKALQLRDEKTLITDIGGGSVEFIITGKGGMLWRKSLEIGAQRLLEKFQHHDPILPEEIHSLNEYLKQKLQPVTHALQVFCPEVLVGSSGTFDTLSEIYCLKHNIPLPVDSPETPLTLNGFAEIYSELIRKNRSERLAIPGMIEMRVDMIVVACCLIKFLLDHYPFSAIRVSSYAMKEGILDQLDLLPD
ncbi:MAG: exopolyphosphatase [Cyclobacteriaceae bacterium]|nr:exopolyphosphatase [Cyclobacteriaceae bacterium]MCX7637789.1 exopolyphosphatase [Cyclobacteriaceae bacterium]MDW8331030.1 exopolyphosphatase [Cyclobacteriaceae bacterium]